MMSGKFTLGTFYQSKQWTTLMKVIKDDRTDERGKMFCAHCGRPIVKAYDCIGHHIEELTEENVNDYGVSLNPDNVQLVHHKCHNIIHDRLGLSRQRQIYLVYGPPLAGKNDWVKENMNDGDLIIDMDNIWQMISGNNRYVKNARLKNVAFGIRDYLLECVKYRRGKWLNAYIIGGYPLISERQRLCRMLGAREVFIDCSKDECIRRVEECKEIENKEEYIGFIANWFDNYSGPPA